MTPDIDLNIRAWTKTRGNITAIGTWIRMDGTFKPCMALIPAGREFDERLIPCVVTQDRAWIWSEEVGDPLEAARTAVQFADALGLSVHDKSTVIRLALFINDMLDDLLHIKPYQSETAGETVADVIMIDHSSGRTVETELKDV